ncbi:tetratricopeptide repeat protein [Leptospira sp. GIMC2001]|uniref:tetratricopeptide repeat protein n=1 Tax=Leptospira sp. GIMC2001 TaxID=1513297 RepID=UPI002349A204|nr:hypothetical protein [Leptospira sp. GIMC2001]WCL47998.1 hypothetical protein O4O04_11785 [Leptospira sp. GIMC2001]
MTYSRYILFFVGMLGFFIISARSITGAKLLELRLNIQKDQIMNYELSSHALRSKLRQVFLDKDDFENEIKINILESSILNSGDQNVEVNLTSWDLAGIQLVNGVRLLSLKKPVKIVDDQRNTLMLQFAFQQERIRKYQVAHNQYDVLENSLNSDSEEAAFVYLHNAFCIAMIGNHDLAIAKLENVISSFPGSHYSKNAKLLISLIQESKSKAKKIKSDKQEPSIYANNLFSNGNYEEAIKVLDSLPNPTPDLSFIRARSQEELGKTSDAVKNYLVLANQKSNRDIAVKANRRLMLIGNFYQTNTELVEVASRNAINLNDTQALKKVEIGKKLTQESKIIKILSDPNANLEIDAETLKELKLEVEATTNEMQKEKEELKTVIQTSKKEEVSVEIQIPTDLKIKITLKDGRVIYANSINQSQDFLNIETNNFPIRTPIRNLKQIQSSRGNSVQSENYLVLTDISGVRKQITEITNKEDALQLISKKSDEMIKAELNHSKIKSISLVR